MIPRKPARAPTSILLKKRRDKGFSITARSLQRDLDSLEIPFALVRKTEGKANYWSFDRDAASAVFMRVLTGLIGWVLSGIWEVSAQAYRVTIPAVVHVAVLRQIHLINEEKEELQ